MPQMATNRSADILVIMASRTTMNISLPPAMKKWVDQQVKERGFGTSSEFVRHVLREAWENATATDLERFLLEGVESPKTPLTRVDIEEMKREVRRRVDRGRGRKSA
jgi:antitoxin ParD1/3/4